MNFREKLEKYNYIKIKKGLLDLTENKCYKFKTVQLCDTREFSLVWLDDIGDMWYRGNETYIAKQFIFVTEKYALKNGYKND